jgi:RNA polymerase sigma-70 factor (family 1)
MTDYDSLSDLELVVLIAKGDENAYAEIYKRYHILLYLYAYRKLNDKESAKDVVQEIFLNLWNKREKYSFNTSISGYLYRSVRNKAFDIFAHKRIEDDYISSLQDFLDSDHTVTDHLIREKEISTLVDKEIAMLPDKMREVFILSRKQYMSHKEIAEHLNISESTVNKQIKRALKILRGRLGLILYLLYHLYP